MKKKLLFAQVASGAEGAVATDEGSLLAMARAEGKVLVAPGTVIALTQPLMLCEEAEDWQRSHCGRKKEDHHCERRPSDPRAAVGAGAEERVWAVGAQAWSAPR